MARRRLTGAAALVFLFAPPAHAWDPQTHVSLLRAAWRISPEAERHTPPEYQAALLEATASADPLDPDCRHHRGGPGEWREAASRAEKLLGQILSEKGADSVYRRAQMVGRYLHFVADAAMPAALAPLRGGSLYQGTDFVVFREPRAPSASLATSLRALDETPAADPTSESARAATFRAAANLLADALLRLPLQPASGTNGHSPAEPDVVFACYGTPPRESTRVRAPQSLPDRAGLHVVEWTRLRSGLVRALLVNNESRCATRVTLESGDWKKPLPLTLAPLSARLVELAAPESVRDPQDVRGTFDVFACKPPHPAEQGARGRRLATLTTTPVPAFEVFTEVEPPRENSVLR